MRDESGDTVSVTTRDGVVLTSGKHVSVKGVHVQNGRAMQWHRFTDGELVAERTATQIEGAGMATPELRLGPGRGLGDEPDLPMQWMSVRTFWRAVFPDIPLDELLTGETVQGRIVSVGGDGAPIRLTQRLTGLAAREEVVDGATLVRLSLTLAVASGQFSYSMAANYLVDPSKGCRLLRVAISADVGEGWPLVDTIAVAQNSDGVWYPSHTHREHTHTQDSRRMGAVETPAVEGRLERTSEFTQFTTSPNIPDDAFAAIPPEGSAARCEALRTDTTGGGR